MGGVYSTMTYQAIPEAISTLSDYNFKFLDIGKAPIRVI